VVRLELEGVQVRGRGWAESCASTIENASGYVVTVISVLQSRAIALVSCYVADLGGESAVTHMRLATDQRASFEQRVLGGLPGASHARACLLDHAAELRVLLEELLQQAVTVEIAERSLQDASGVWGQREPAAGP
jgi:hypothetical protein